MRRLSDLVLLLSLLVVQTALAQTRECVSDCGCPPGYVCQGDEYSTRCEPGVCANEFAPVCGLDGLTYRNSCFASLQRIGIAYEGVCGRCGGLGGRKCASCEFCDLDVGSCKVAAAEGICRSVPAACNQEDRPVCGCNGRTYPNDCIRLMARVALAYEGPCVVPPKSTPTPPPAVRPSTPRPATPRPSTPRPATPRPATPRPPSVAPLGPPCPPAPPLPSAPAESSAVPAPSAPAPSAGSAIPVPPDPTPSIPVPSPSELSGVPESVPDSKICSSNRDCRESEFCSRPLGRCDISGRCTARGAGCKEDWVPVCGCDGITYTNQCWASASGQSLKCTDSCDRCGSDATP